MNAYTYTDYQHIIIYYFISFHSFHVEIRNTIPRQSRARVGPRHPTPLSTRQAHASLLPAFAQAAEDIPITATPNQHKIQPHTRLATNTHIARKHPTVPQPKHLAPISISIQSRVEQPHCRTLEIPLPLSHVPHVPVKAQSILDVSLLVRNRDHQSLHTQTTLANQYSHPQAQLLSRNSIHPRSSRISNGLQPDQQPIQHSVPRRVCTIITDTDSTRRSLRIRGAAPARLPYVVMQARRPNPSPAPKQLPLKALCTIHACASHVISPALSGSLATAPWSLKSEHGYMHIRRC